MGKLTKWTAAVTCVAAVGVAACGDSSEENKPEKLTAQELVRQSRPSTVKLYGKWGDTSRSGTGVVIDAKRGLVLTNAHVVDGTSGLKAQVNDQPEEYTARVKATAPCDDLAVVELTVPPAGLRSMPMGRSSSLEAGQHVTTLGYPGTLEDTDVAGSSRLVFADGRISTPETSSTLYGLGEYPSLVQHTAPTNSGSSGGPLVDDFGRLIGINTLGNTGTSGEVQGQYYSIAIDHAKPLIEKLKQGISIADVGWTLVEFGDGSILRDYLPADIVEETLSWMRHEQDTRGVYVMDTRAGTPADRADVVPGDFISYIEGNLVTSPSEVCDAFESATPGSLVKVHGRYLDSAYAYSDPDILPGDSWSLNVRVPREDATPEVSH